MTTNPAIAFCRAQWATHTGCRNTRTGLVQSGLWLWMASVLLVPSHAGVESPFNVQIARTSEEPRAATQDLNEIRDRVLGNLSKLRNIKARISSWNAATASHPDVAVVAAKDQSRYELQWHGGFKGPTDDPESSERFYDGEHWNVFRPFERLYEVTQRFAGRPYSDKILRHFFFECLGWWPPGDSSPPLKREGEPKFLNEILSDSRCRVEPLQEPVDGEWCHVVELPGVERLWVAMPAGVVRQRQLFILDGTEKGKTLAVLHMRNYKELEAGFSLPEFIERDLAAAGKVTYHRIDSYHINTLDDDLLAFSPPPGTLVYDRDMDSFHQIPGGLDALELIAKRVIARTAPAQSIPTLERVDVRWVMIFLFGCAVYAGGCICSPVFRRPR